MNYIISVSVFFLQNIRHLCKNNIFGFFFSLRAGYVQEGGRGEEDFLCIGVNTAFTKDVEATKVMDFPWFLGF